jgi:hypothetical protein
MQDYRGSAARRWRLGPAVVWEKADAGTAPRVCYAQYRRYRLGNGHVEVYRALNDP